MVFVKIVFIRTKSRLKGKKNIRFGSHYHFFEDVKTPAGCFWTNSVGIELLST